MAARNTTKVFHTLKTASLEKAKTETTEMYWEVVLLQEILDSINRHVSVGITSKGTPDLMSKALRGQFTRYEISWEKSMWDDSGNNALFDKFQELYLTVNEAVDNVLYPWLHATEKAVDKALFKSEKFLQSSPIHEDVSEDVSEDIGWDASEDVKRDVKEDLRRDAEEIPTCREVPGRELDVRRDVGEDVRRDGEDIPIPWEVPRSELDVWRDMGEEVIVSWVHLISQDPRQMRDIQNKSGSQEDTKVLKEMQGQCQYWRFVQLMPSNLGDMMWLDIPGLHYLGSAPINTAPYQHIPSV